MLDTLQINDRVFVNRLAYLFDEPKVGDIVVFKVPETIPQYDPEKPIPELGGFFEGGLHVLFGDGSVRAISDDTEEPILRGLFSAAGGEAIGEIREAF